MKIMQSVAALAFCGAALAVPAIQGVRAEADLVMGMTQAERDANTAAAEAWTAEVIEAVTINIPQAEKVEVGAGGLYAFVEDNGQNRDGLALAICETIDMATTRPEHMSLPIVHILDVNSRDRKDLGFDDCRP